jgi:uncharacterized membrane protein YbhN (UPF0104 family)
MKRMAARRRALATVVGSVAVTAVAGTLVAALPSLVGATWSAVGASLLRVPALVLAGMFVLWFLGLLVHVRVLVAAMPGLTGSQALRLNLSGSAVSNVLPLGGPAGMGLGYAMARSWGFASDRFASYTLATNVWNAVGKLVMGMSVLAVAALFGAALPSGLGRVVVSAVAVVAIGAVATAVAFRTERATLSVGRRLDLWISRVRPRGPEAPSCSQWMLSCRREFRDAVGAGWRSMSAGVLCYLLLQAALLFGCLAAVHAGASVKVVAISFAIERLISLAPITPGASGVAELGTVAALHSFGVDPVGAAAGVLLYRILVFAIEIPIGGAIALTWLRRARRPHAVGHPTDTYRVADGHLEAPSQREPAALTAGGGSG